MAKKPAAAASPAAYDPAVTYKVTVARVVDTGRRKLKPRDEHEMTGAFLADLVAQHGEEIVVSASPVV